MTECIKNKCVYASGLYLLISLYLCRLRLVGQLNFKVNCMDIQHKATLATRAAVNQVLTQVVYERTRVQNSVKLKNRKKVSTFENAGCSKDT